MVEVRGHITSQPLLPVNCIIREGLMEVRCQHNHKQCICRVSQYQPMGDYHKYSEAPITQRGLLKLAHGQVIRSWFLVLCNYYPSRNFKGCFVKMSLKLRHRWLFYTKVACGFNYSSLPYLRADLSNVSHLELPTFSLKIKKWEIMLYTRKRIRVEASLYYRNKHTFACVNQ